jgi:sugar O-acyltransferase (sialic acid O-acetyltransferase NeuD family)
MTFSLYAVYGAGGHGREVMPLAREQLKLLGIPATQLVFVDDAPQAPYINGQQVFSYTEFMQLEADKRHVALSMANSAVREKLSVRCATDGVLPWTVTAGNVVTMDDLSIGEGAILSPFVMLTSNVRIGHQFHANMYSYVAHDCIIGDFVTFAPGAKCNGNIVIGDHAYIGAGAIIKQGKLGQPLIIGRGAVVGMGAVVTQDVPPGATVVGNPARLFVKR